MTTKKSGIGDARLDASVGSVYEPTPEQQRAVATLVHRKANDDADEQHLLTVLGITPQDGEK